MKKIKNGVASILITAMLFVVGGAFIFHPPYDYSEAYPFTLEPMDNLPDRPITH